ncbi:MAG TPA: hypothetical protein DCF42_06475 [Lachnospiraceae bacterium]|nr:hypothetical protein [Lachnospiraceae bacterium]
MTSIIQKNFKNSLIKPKMIEQISQTINMANKIDKIAIRKYVLSFCSNVLIIQRFPSGDNLHCSRGMIFLFQRLLNICFLMYTEYIASDLVPFYSDIPETLMV